MSDPPVWSFVAIYFGPATLDPSLSVDEVPPDHSPDGYLQQSVCSVSCEAFTACLSLQRVGVGGRVVDIAPKKHGIRPAAGVESCPSIHFL